MVGHAASAVGLALTGSDQVPCADAWGHVLRCPVWVRGLGCCAWGVIPAWGAVSVSLPCDGCCAGFWACVVVVWASSSVG